MGEGVEKGKHEMTLGAPWLGRRARCKVGVPGGD